MLSCIRLDRAGTVAASTAFLAPCPVAWDGVTESAAWEPLRNSMASRRWQTLKGSPAAPVMPLNHARIVLGAAITAPGGLVHLHRGAEIVRRQQADWQGARRIHVWCVGNDVLLPLPEQRRAGASHLRLPDHLLARSLLPYRLPGDNQQTCQCFQHCDKSSSGGGSEFQPFGHPPSDLDPRRPS